MDFDAVILFINETLEQIRNISNAHWLHPQDKAEDINELIDKIKEKINGL